MKQYVPWVGLCLRLATCGTYAFVLSRTCSIRDGRIPSRPQDTSLYSTSLDSNNHDYTPYLATCIPGVSQLLAEEIAEIHPEIRSIETSGKAAVTFQATRRASLEVLCWTRMAHKLLELVAESSSSVSLYLRDRQDLQEFVRDHVHVPSLLGDGSGGLLTLSVQTMLNNPRQLPKDLTHSHYTSLSIKNALCDVVRDMRGDRPSVDIDQPDVPLVAVLKGVDGGEAATMALYRSLHTGSLHKRGYRSGAIHKAAMKESMAAALLREAKWHEMVREQRRRRREEEDLDGRQEPKPLRLVDPMCGSGPFMLEGIMMAADIAPGLMRITCGLPGSQLPPVTKWKSLVGEPDNVQVWKDVLTEAKERAKDGLAWTKQSCKDQSLAFYANDIHSGALEMLEASLNKAQLTEFVQTSNKDCYDLHVPKRDSDIPFLVVTNPPWGVRLTDDMEESREGLRHFLRDTCPAGTTAWILSGHKGATASLKLRRSGMLPLQTADQTLRWIQYQIGSPAKAAHEEPVEAMTNKKGQPKDDKVAKKKPANEWMID